VEEYVMKQLLLVVVSAFLLISAQAQVHQVDKTKTLYDELNDVYCSGMFKSTDGTILEVASNPSAKSYWNILEWLQGRVSGLSVYKSAGGVSIPLIRNSVPGIYVDEMPVSLSYLNGLNVNDIAIVKIIKMPFYGGFNSGGGAIAIYTIRDESEESD
jgi:hypothetical protein